MNETIRAIKLTKLENDLLDLEKEIKRCEGIINSVKIFNQRFKDDERKRLNTLVNKRIALVSTITEAIFLGAEV